MTCPYIHCNDLVTIHDLTLYPRSGFVTCPFVQDGRPVPGAEPVIGLAP